MSDDPEDEAPGHEWRGLLLLAAVVALGALICWGVVGLAGAPP